MVTLYDFAVSGNCYKVRLLLHQLSLPYRRVALDRSRADQRQPEFLKRNPMGKVPVVEWEDGRILTESNAILAHFAEGSPLWPSDPWLRAQALKWMFFEQAMVMPNLGVARLWVTLLKQADQHKAALEEKQKLGHQALSVMEEHLRAHDFFAGAYSAADIALYAYTHLAPEGNVELSQYRAVGQWMDRVRSQPRHIPLSA